MLSSGHVIPEIVKLGEECPVYSIRGTCFYVLGLLASTRIGTDMLSKLGWESLCRRRSEMWPLVEEPDFIFAEDSLSSVGSLSNQLGELDADDGCSSTLARLDEDDIGEDLRIEENSFNSMHQTFNELNDFGVLNRCNDNKSPNQETSPMESKSHSPSMRDDTIQIRSKFVSESTNSDLSCKSHPASSPVSRIGNAKSPCYKWSNTLPLVRTKPLTAESLHNSTVFTESECSRQRSRSMTQRPHISETITEAWERRNKVVSSEINCCSGHSSPRGSTRVPPRLKITSRERIRCDSLNDGIKYSDIDSPSASSVFCRGPRHLRSSSNIEIGQCRVGPHVSGMQSEYGDTVIPLSNASFKDRRSDSNESSHTSTSKSRSNSCTDSTSGFSSCESNNIRPVTSSTTMERPQLLSPIASSSSLNTMSGRTVHHSDPTRKLVNLRKTPVILCRVSAPVNLITNTTSLPGFTVPSTPSLSPDVHTMESFAFTTTRDAQGYATLRSLRQRRRGFSTCVVPDQKLLEYNLRAAKTRSLDSRLEIPRLLTFVILLILLFLFF